MGAAEPPDQWVAALGGDGAERDDAEARLHGALLRVARSELSRRHGQLNVSGPELDDLAHQAAADAMVAIMARLDQFRGESRFTTWAYKFVMFEVSAEDRTALLAHSAHRVRHRGLGPAAGPVRVRPGPGVRTT